jgi:hypothetical protein
MIEEIKSRALDSVEYNGGKRTRRPSIVTMAVDHRFAVEVSELNEDIKNGGERTEGLVGVKLVAVYAEPGESVHEKHVELHREPGQEDLIKEVTD